MSENTSDQEIGACGHGITMRTHKRKDMDSTWSMSMSMSNENLYSTLSLKTSNALYTLVVRE